MKAEVLLFLVCLLPDSGLCVHTGIWAVLGPVSLVPARGFATVGQFLQVREISSTKLVKKNLGLLETSCLLPGTGEAAERQ